MGYRLAPPPFPEEDEIGTIADWAEIQVLSEQGHLTRGEIQGGLSRESVRRPEAKAEEVWAELERRGALYGDVWPLRIRGQGLYLLRQADHDLILLHYFFCALSYGYNVTNDGRLLFEICVADLIKGIGINMPFGLRLGAPRTPGFSPSFHERVVLYTKLSKEVYDRPVEVHDQDLGLDVASWQVFPDDRGGSLHFIGQCATGVDWFDKLDDLNMGIWRDHVRWYVEPVRFFALPHVVPPERWRRACLRGGLVLDRPRLTKLAQISPLHRRWYAEMFNYCRKLYA